MMNHPKFLIGSVFRMAAVGLVLASAGFSACAGDSERITQLENEVRELKLRLSNLESGRGVVGVRPDAAAPKVEAVRSAAVVAAQPAPAKEESKPVGKWAELEKGMSPDEVRGILGAPQKTQTAGVFMYWDYANRGSVTFHQSRLNGWIAPQ